MEKESAKQLIWQVSHDLQGSIKVSIQLVQDSSINGIKTYCHRCWVVTRPRNSDQLSMISITMIMC